MNDIEQRLTHDLKEVAAQARPEPDLDGVLLDGALHSTRRQRLVQPTTTRRRWLAPVAAAALITTGVGGLWALQDQRDPGTASQPAAATPSTPSTAPTAPTNTATRPTSFPVLEQLPAERYSAQHAFDYSRAPSDTYSSALVGRAADGTWTDPVQIAAFSTPVEPSAMEDLPPVDTVVMGEPATVYRYTDYQIVVWGSGPYLTATGASSTTFVEQLETGAIKTADGEPPSIGFGDLPEGFEVLVEPQQLGRFQGVLSIADGDGGSNIDIVVSTDNPAADLALRGTVRSLEVNGQPAWTLGSGAEVGSLTWQVDDNTYVYLKFEDGSDVDAMVEFAEQLSFVDYATWVGRYSPETNNDTTPSTAPATTAGPETDDR